MIEHDDALDTLFAPRADRPWVAEAACKDRPGGYQLFFPDDAAVAEIALRICDGCPVKAPCLDYAIEYNERGIWGGTSERGREQIRRSMRTLSGRANRRPYTNDSRRQT